MTRVEAINILQGAIKKPNTKDGYLGQAIDMAIKALEQEPCEDVISRQATVERLCKVAEFMNEKRKGLGSPYVMAALFIQDNKDEFPPITPQPKTGHWIAVENEEMETDGYYCSECDLPMETEQRTNFCPNCGAKMAESDKA